jgi:hypothetical protein
LFNLLILSGPLHHRMGALATRCYDLERKCIQ